MNNPYASKKSAAPQLFTTPLEAFDTFVEDDEPQQQQQQPQQQRALSDDGTTAINQHQQSNDRGATVQQSTTTLLPSLTNNDDDEPMSMSVQLPLWKRLPSQTISFSSAEILTISEVCQHGLLYCNNTNHAPNSQTNFQTQSMRTTGVLRHRVSHPETGEMSLVLEDPLAKLSSMTSSSGCDGDGRVATTTTHTKSASRRRISFGTTSSKTDSTTTATSTVATNRRPSLGMARTHRTTPLLSRTATTSAAVAAATATPGHNNVSVGTSNPGFQTPTCHTQRTAVAAASSHTIEGGGGSSSSRRMPMNTTASKFRTPGRLGGGGGANNTALKRPFSSVAQQTPSSSTTKNPLDAMMDALAAKRSHGNLLWVVVSDPHHVPVDTVAVGDIVTVMGILNVYTNSNSAKDNTDSGDGEEEEKEEEIACFAQTSSHRSAAVRKIGQLVLKQRQQQQNDVKQSGSTSSTHLYYMEPRILRQDNGANLALHWEALKLRRRHLLKSYHYNDASHNVGGKEDCNTGATTRTTKLLPGCGPPPYDYASSSTNKADI